MKALTELICLLLTLLLTLSGVIPTLAASYPATIKYRQTMTKIVDEIQLRGWPASHADGPRHIEEIIASPTNNHLAFTVKLDVYDPSNTDTKRLYVRGNGTELVDCTPYLTEAGVNPNNVYSLRMSHDGNRIFFFGVYGTDIYYLVPWFVWKVYPAFKGLAGGDGRLPYTVHYDGSKLFFKHVVNAGSLDSIPGLYYANVGDPTYTPHLMMPMSKLPGNQNANLLWYLGSSEYGGSLLCKWYSSTTNSQAMWRVPTPSNPPNPSQDPVKVPLEDHNAVWDNSDLYNKIVASQIGAPEGTASALYAYRDSGQLDKLYYVDLISGEKKRLLTADGGPFNFPALYDNGAFVRIARFNSPHYYNTRVNLLTGEQRDTFSYPFFAEGNNGSYYLTDLVDDSSGTFARFFYMACKPAGQTARIHQIDMAAPPGGNGLAPLISSISFNKEKWNYIDTTPLTITAQVNDPKGRNNLEFVQMQVLVDGLASPAWLTNGYKPITEAQMFDSGGNGIFTCTSNLYKISAFYTHYRLPHEVGIRIITKNKDAHYMIADTTITIDTPGVKSNAAVNSLLLAD